METTRTRDWVVVPERSALHVHLDRPTSVIDGYEIIERAEHLLAQAKVLMLEGPGWCTPRTWKTARLLRERANQHGVEMIIESAPLMLDEHA